MWCGSIFGTKWHRFHYCCNLWWVEPLYCINTLDYYSKCYLIVLQALFLKERQLYLKEALRLDFTCLALWDHIKWNIPTGLSRYYDYDVHKWNKNDDRHDIAIVSREIAEAEKGGIQVCYWRAISEFVLLWVLLTHWCREQDVILRL